MRERRLQTYAYPVLKLAPGTLALISAVTSAALKADIKALSSQYGQYIGGLISKWQAIAWIIILFSACAIILSNFALRWLGEPWRWDAVQVVLDKFRERVYFNAFPDDPLHYHRVTLFRHVPVVFQWKKWPWSGWLVPMARSGYTNQRSNTVFRAPDDADRVQGVAGMAWASKRIESISGLPEVYPTSHEIALREYSTATKMDISVLRRRKSNPRALIAIPIEVNNRVKWIVVLDSREPRDLLRSAEEAAAGYTPIISHLLKGV